MAENIPQITGEALVEQIGKQDDEKLLATALERYKQSVEIDDENRRNFEDDIEFYSGETQWNQAVQKSREQDNRPCITVNRLPSFVRQVVNDYRQNKTTVNVRAVDDNADPETADIMKGIIRHIESNSDADIAYENALFYAVTGGFGYYRIVTDYIEDGFDQEIYIRPIPNSLTVRHDCNSRAMDGSDWEWCFIEEQMSKKAAEKAYPDVDFGDWDNATEKNVWMSKDEVTVVEYFYFETVKEKLFMLETGEAIYESDFEKKKAENPQYPAPAIIDTRTVSRKKVKWAKLAGDKVLEKADWAGKYIPVIPVFGDVIEVKGQRKTISLIRFAKDAQRMLNYYRSTETELLALQPKAPFVIAEGQIEGYEDEWQNANSVAYSALTYKPTTIDGMAVPPPQRQGFASPPSGVLQGAMNAEQDMMNTTGIHEASMGMKSNESSGRAILARQREGDVSTFHFIDNAARAQRYCGRQLVDLIPKIYDRARVVRILGDDDTEKMVTVNEPTTRKDDNGNEIDAIYNLGLGRYDVVVSSGASYTTRRQEQAEAMMNITQANPQLWATAGDILVKAMDWPDADVLAKRLKKTLPPGLADSEDEDGEGEPQLPPEVMQQMEEMNAQLEQAGQMVQELQAQLESKQPEYELQARKIAVDEFNAETNRIKTMADVQAKQPAPIASDELSDAEADKINFEAEMKAALIELEHENKKELIKLQAALDMMKTARDDMSMESDMEGKGMRHGQEHGGMDEMNNKIHECMEAIRCQLEQQNAPKEIIRDASGKPIGIKSVSVQIDE